MNFINKYVVTFALIATVICASFFMAMEYFITNGIYSMLLVSAILYAAFMFILGMFIGSKDIYEGYIGLNYHLTTYAICNIVPLVLICTGLVTKFTYHHIFSIMLFWGVFTIPHIIAFITMRKRSIRGIDKKELFD